MQLKKETRVDESLADPSLSSPSSATDQMRVGNMEDETISALTSLSRSIVWKDGIYSELFVVFSLFLFSFPRLVVVPKFGQFFRVG